MLKSKQGVAAFVLVLGAMLLGAKLVAWQLTGSNAILSDALESIINVAAGGFALYSIRLADKPRDADHPYGHGKVEYLSSGMEGFLISAAGLAVAGKAIYNLFSPGELGNLEIGVIITSATGLVNLGLGLWLRNSGKRHRSLILDASGRHLLSDAWTTAGIVIGLILIRITGATWIDNAAAIFFGLLIVRSGWLVLRKSLGGIMDEADFKTLDEIIALLDREREDTWIDMHNLRAIRYGDMLHVDAHVTMPWYLSLQESHAASKRLEGLLAANASGSFEAFIHVDPCVSESCSICAVKACSHRKHEFVRRLPWTRDNVLSEFKHSLKDT